MPSPPVVRGLPSGLERQAQACGIASSDALYSVESDLKPDGKPGTVWLVVASQTLAVLNGDPSGEPVLAGPYRIGQIQKIRSFQTVGSAFLQALIDGLYVNVVRYSNARREAFGRARVHLERLIAGESPAPDALLRPSELVCSRCALPLPGRGAECPKCSGRHGVLLRSLAMLRRHVGAIILLLIMMIAGVSLDLLPPQLTRILVDRVLQPREHLNWLPFILLGLVGASAARTLTNVFIGRTSSAVGTRITRELRERLQAKLLSLSVDYYGRHSVGSLMSRVLYDVDYFQGFVAQVAQGFLLNLGLVFGVGAMLFFMNRKLALLVLVPIPFVVVGTLFFWKHVYPRYYQVWDSQSKMAQLLSGLLSGIRVVKAYGQEDREKKRFARNAGYMQNARRRLDIGAATFNPIMGFVFGLGGLIVWYAGGGMVFHEEISLGTLMAFFGYLGMFYAPISSLSVFSNWATGFVSAGQRIFEILDSSAMLPPPPDPARPPALRGGIEFQNVTFGYDPHEPVLKNVSFRIEPGRFVGIVGKSGSGKTSIVNLICRFYDTQQGRVMIDGLDVRALDPTVLQRHVGLVLQEPFMFRGTIADNIAYGNPDAPPLAIMDAARAANAHAFVSRRASAYDTRLGENGAGLSGGERQRISIARALLCDPTILILDEATSSVDTESEQEIQQALQSMCRGRTTIAIAHRLSTLKNADLILVVDDGRIVESGTHEALLENQDGIYHRLVKIQTELTRLEV